VQARAAVGEEMWVGVSTHNLEQFRRAAATSADYIAVGPIFLLLQSKSRSRGGAGIDPPSPPAHRSGHCRDRGITLDSAASVIAAGADSVAVIRDVLCAAKPAEQARRFLETLEAANHAAAV